MGRLPTHFAGRLITARQPQSFAAEVILTSAQLGQPFPEGSFLNNTDRPFEIHRVIPFLIALDINNVSLNPQPDQDLMMGLMRMKITDLGNGPTSFMKSTTMIRALVKGDMERTWEFADPYYLVKSNQLDVTCDALTFPANGAIANLNGLKLCLNFEGFFITIAPASDAR